MRLAHIELNLRERRRIKDVPNAKASVRNIAEAILFYRKLHGAVGYIVPIAMHYPHDATSPSK